MTKASLSDTLGHSEATDPNRLTVESRSSPMSDSPYYQHLLNNWREQPSPALGASLAEGYRKQGRLEEARQFAGECVARWNEYLPGFLVQARVFAALGDWGGAEVVLKRALELDPSHPVVFSLLAETAEATGHGGDALAWRQLRQASVVEIEPPVFPDFLAAPVSPGGRALWEGEPPPLETESDLDEEMLSESLAALYQAQGHLERAAEVYASLADREPGNHSLVERRDRLRVEIAQQRPRPYDSRLSGGEPVRAWLGRIAASVPTTPG